MKRRINLTESKLRKVVAETVSDFIHSMPNHKRVNKPLPPYLEDDYDEDDVNNVDDCPF